MTEVVIDGVTYVPKEVEKEENKFPLWEELGKIDGFYTTSYSSVERAQILDSTSSDRCVFATKEQAEGMLAAAQLSQLMKGVNGDWRRNEFGTCFCIMNKTIVKATEATCSRIYFLSFKDKETANLFLKAYRPLIMQFFKGGFS